MLVSDIKASLYFTSGGGVGDIIHGMYTSAWLRSILDIKEKYKNVLIKICINGHDEKTNTDLWRTVSGVDIISWRKEDTDFRKVLLDIIGPKFKSDFYTIIKHDLSYPWVDGRTFLSSIGYRPTLMGKKWKGLYLVEEDYAGLERKHKSLFTDRKCVGLGIFSHRGHPSPGWWFELARKLTKAGFVPVVVGSEVDFKTWKECSTKRQLNMSAEKCKYAEIIDFMVKERLAVGGFDLSIREMYVLISKLSGFVSGDTGLKDLAWVNRIPSILLIGKSATMTDEWIGIEGGAYWGCYDSTVRDKVYKFVEPLSEVDSIRVDDVVSKLKELQ